MIYHDRYGSWQCDITANQYGEKRKWVDDIQDPFALTYTSAEFSSSYQALAYDRIFTERLRSEYENADFPEADPNELKALMNMLEENIGKFSHEVTEYLTSHYRPLITLYEMTTISLISNKPELEYNPYMVNSFVEEVEIEVQSRQNRQKKPLDAFAQHIGDMSVNLAVIQTQIMAIMAEEFPTFKTGKKVLDVDIDWGHVEAAGKVGADLKNIMELLGLKEKEVEKIRNPRNPHYPQYPLVKTPKLKQSLASKLSSAKEKTEALNPSPKAPQTNIMRE